MAENGAPMTLSTPWGDVDFNTRFEAEFFISETDGLDGVPVRAPIEDAPQTDGALVFDFFDGPRHITIRGFITPPSGSVVDAVQTVNGMTDALVAACKSIRRADGTFTYSPTGQGSRTWTVRCDVQPTTSGRIPKEFMFGLVAADPEAA
jgi:hypothetical protein